MVKFSVDTFFLIYVGVGFVPILGLWFYYDWKQAQLFEAKCSKVIYHCIKCSQIYTGPQGSEEFDCPRCRFKNGRLRF